MDTFQSALANYLSKDENAEVSLAGKVGKSQAAINRYRNGKRFPDAQTARLIDQHTDGEVPFAVWEAEFLSRSGIAA